MQVAGATGKWFVELKKDSSSSGIPNSVVGQVLKYFFEFSRSQPMRGLFYGAVVNPKYVYFLRYTALGAPHFSMDISIGYAMSEQPGPRMLVALMSASDDDLGFHAISASGWQVGAVLGHGATATVFKATKVDSTVGGAGAGGPPTANAIKVFRTKDTPAAPEVVVLRHLAASTLGLSVSRCV